MKLIRLGVLDQNLAAIRVYEKAGFKVKEIGKRTIKHENKLYIKIVMIKEKNEHCK